MNHITDELTWHEVRALTTEQKKARRKAQKNASAKAYRATPEGKAKDLARAKRWKENNPERYKQRTKQYQIDNEPRLKQWRKDYYQSTLTNYVVYKHTSPEGAVYIGSGTNRRPYSWSRSTEWHAAFNKDTVKVKILREYFTREDAYAYEAELIKSIGLSNLVNVDTPDISKHINKNDDIASYNTSTKNSTQAA
tara:strand:+ start:46 stop:627 length:582 start_codon:yes stop_codon:yes gene_type:complete